MAGASDPPGRPRTWRGVSGRVYRREEGAQERRGTRHRVIPVVPVDGGGAGPSPKPPSGRRAALLLPARRAPAAVRAFEARIEALQRLSRAAVASPAPRLHERLADGPGAVIEWCEVDLDSWWVGCCDQPDAFRSMCLVLAEVCRRLADWAAIVEGSPDSGPPLPDIRPRSVLRTGEGRWVLFGIGRSSGPATSGDDDLGTEMMTSASGYDAPERLFSARCEDPLATRTWAIGATMFALLKVRALVMQADDGRGPELPAGGTDSVHLRSHRAALIDDLLQRKPGLFAGRPLDPRQFLYPDRLPDRDRRTIARAVSGLFGDEQPSLEDRLKDEILAILDRALSIAPKRRHRDPAALADAFEALARRYRSMRASVAASRLRAAPAAGPDAPEDTDDDAIADSTQVMMAGPVGTPRLPTAALTPLVSPPVGGSGPAAGEGAGRNAAATAPDPDPAPLPPAAASSPPTAASAASEAAAGTPRPDALPNAPAPSTPISTTAISTTAISTPPAPARGVPRWVKLALGALAFGQAATLVLVGVLWVRLDHGPAAAGRPPAVVQPSVTGLLQEAFDDPAQGDPAVERPTPPAKAAPDTDMEPAAPPSSPQREAQTTAGGPPPGDDRVRSTPDPSQAPRQAAASATDDVLPGATSASSRPTAERPAPGQGQRAASRHRARSEPRTGRVTVSAGDSPTRLVGPDGIVSPGELAAGTYTVQLEEGGSWVDKLRVSVDAGEAIEVTCGFGQCRRSR